MKIIIEKKEITYYKEKSKFIGLIFKVNDEEEIKDILNDVQKLHPYATHICYAYLLPNKMKYSDDGEPSGTAGLPILEVLQKNDLNYCLGVVVRYFGGIKLGANGLVRAYTKAISDTINSNIKDLEYGYLISITEDYSKEKELNYLLKGSQIIQKDYQNKIYLQVLVNKKTLDSLSSINYEIIQEQIL